MQYAWDMTNAYTILLENLTETNHLEDLAQMDGNTNV
jgi:hypothetical protein